MDLRVPLEDLLKIGDAIAIVAGVMCVTFAAMWLLRANRENEYNRALSKYDELKRMLTSSQNDPTEFLQGAVDTLRLCQAAIERQKNNGDAYLLLANTYLGLAQRFRTNGIYNMGFQFASAIMTFLQDSPTIHIRNKRQAKAMQKMILDGYKHVADSSRSRSRKELEAIFSGDYSTTLGKAISSSNLPSIQNAAASWIDLEVAIKEFEADRNPEALMACNTAIARFPDLAAGYFLRAQIWLAEGNYVAALTDIDSLERIEELDQMSILTRQEAERGIRSEASRITKSAPTVVDAEYAETLSNFVDSQQEIVNEKNRLRSQYESRFQNWDEFENRVADRLHSTMAEKDVHQKFSELRRADPESLETMYYRAASDVLFHMEAQLFPGLELHEHESWMNILLQKEYDALSSSTGSGQGISAKSNERSEGSKTIEQVVTAIEHLSRLYKQGIISEEEFSTKKADLLGRI